MTFERFWAILRLLAHPELERSDRNFLERSDRNYQVITLGKSWEISGKSGKYWEVWEAVSKLLGSNIC